MKRRLSLSLCMAAEKVGEVYLEMALYEEWAHLKTEHLPIGSLAKTYILKNRSAEKK